jgi:CelD/BcsL family acetyltransferase involved in cellulose biosynthesis
MTRSLEGIGVCGPLAGRPAVAKSDIDFAVRCEIVADFERLAEFSPEWKRLTQSDVKSDIFQHWSWARAFWRANGATLRLCAPVVYRNESVIGMAPLVRRGEVIEFLGAPDSDYNDLLCEERDAPAVLQATLLSLLQSLSGWESCIFDNLPAHSRIVRHLGTLPSSLRRHLQLVFRQPAPTILLDRKARETLIELSNKDYRGKHRKLQKLGRVAFRHLETRDEARQHLSGFFDQHITRWALKGLKSAFLQPECRDFYAALIEELDPRNELRFGVLELDDQPIAYHFGFQTNGKFTWYKPAFDVRYWDYCPGDVLVRRLLEYAFEGGVQEFDFSIGDHSFKHRFANHMKENYAVYLERHPARLRSRVNAFIRSGQQAIRRRPAVKNFCKDLLQRVEAAVSQASRLGCRGLARRCTDAVSATYRQTIWTSGEVIVLSYDVQPGGDPSPVEIIRGHLDLLARLSLKYPDYLNEKRLRDYRVRLKQGDRAFVAYYGDETCLLWLRRRTAVSVPEIGLEFIISPSEQALVIYEASTTPDFRSGEVPEEVFRALAKRCEVPELWIHCLYSQPALLRALENVGFEPKYRVRHWASLHCFHRTHVTSLHEAEPNSERASHACL